MAVVLGVARTYSFWNTQGAPPAERSGGDHPKMKIVAEGGTKFVVPYAPREVTTEGIIPEWATVARGGRRPLLLRSGEGLPTMSFDLIFGHLDKNKSIEDELGELRKLAKTGKRFKVTLDRTAAAYHWRLTRFTQQVVERKHGSNAATRALCSLTFTAASDANVSVGPLSGGDDGDDDPDRPKFYIVKKGDTLESIAKRFYGKATAWRKIADANNIRDPKKIDVGDKLRLP